MVNLKKPNQKWDSIDDYSKEEAPDELHLVPEIAGAGGVAAAVAVYAVSVVATTFGFTAVAGILTNLAVGLLIQGIMSLLFPVELPKTSAQTTETKIDTSSYIFTNLQNNAIQGFPIPLVYGEMRIGSNIIATNVVSEDLG